MSFIDSVAAFIQNNQTTVKQGATLLTAITKTIAAGHDGTQDSVFKTMVSLVPDVEPVLESLVSFLGIPGGAVGVKFAAFMLTHAHKMTPAEEAAWMDRASNPYAGGA